MKIFKELKKLGYRHYAECTIEELDNLPLNSEERIMEQALVLRWFREKYGLQSYIRHECPDVESYYDFVINEDVYDVMKDTHEEAELACLRKLIEIVKEKQS